MSKVFVSGCFDLLHSGHITFLEKASKHGDLYVGLGSDKNIIKLKNKEPRCNEHERLYMVKSLRFVKDAFINSGFGHLDFTEEVKSINPDIFYVNKDGDSEEKRIFCANLGIRYIVEDRDYNELFEERSTTKLSLDCKIPYRIDLAGGWMDQLFLNKDNPGSVVTISIDPTCYNFQCRSGMSTSTRKSAIELFGNNIPTNFKKEKTAKILFSYENSLFKKKEVDPISGSQDSIGIVFPGVNNLYYNKNYWPENISSIHNKETITWLESCIKLVELNPRDKDYNPLKIKNITNDKIIRLSNSAKNCWESILKKDVKSLGQSVTETYLSQKSMFSCIETEEMRRVINKYKDISFGYKVCGAGGGGYMIFITEENRDDFINIKIINS